ncbi:MAG: class II glutamine amidotransferase [Halobacteriovoraceae bacterium]|jgi:predicted glutamine amidotransferase|nr:class II glutamine amidotransferase [Halobacteriovoraceae bacterium]
MCRLFGFRSVIDSQVHSSLVHADNALGSQSVKHPDGWGVAYYREDIPHLIKSTERAIDDQLFHKVSGVVSSQTVIAHIRNATQGQLNVLNSHPFQYGKWVFAHNGNLKNFEQYKEKLLSHIDPALKHFILGTTDSEIIFYLLLSLIKKKSPLAEVDHAIGFYHAIIEELCQTICQYSGPLYAGEVNNPKENHLTFILTSGETMLGFQGGQQLNYSTHKSLCPERDTCSFYAKVCEESATTSEKVNHLLFSSEQLTGENVWVATKRGQLIAVDSDMKFSKSMLKVPFR